MTLLFQYINFEYLRLFGKSQLDDLDTYEQKLATVRSNIEQFKQINFLGIIASASLLLYSMQKFAFNGISKQKVSFDIWTFLDLACGISNLIALTLSGGLTADEIIDSTRKELMDSYLAIVIISSWLRFFSYFLLIYEISKLIMTLLKMLLDTVAFLFICFCYLVLASAVFTTIFMNVAPDLYGSIYISLRTLLDIMVANFEYRDMGNFNTSHSVCLMIHAMIANVFLVNFLVAIISTVYNYMLVGGEFSYKCMKYQFYEKYSIAMHQEPGLREITIHPPPFNYLTAAMLLVTFSQKLVSRVGNFLSKAIFWLENGLLIALLALFELIILPYAYLRVCWNVLRVSAYHQLLFFLIFWIAFGLPILGAFLLRDIANFFILLLDYQEQQCGEEGAALSVQQRVDCEDRVVIFNEVLQAMKEVKHLIQLKKAEYEGQEEKDAEKLFNASNEKYQVSLGVLI